MKITHVIRGDDHMINSFKQKQIYDAMGWDVPNFAHIPLIHSQQGKKLSKRDNACLLYTSPSPRDKRQSRMPSSA